MSWAKLIFSHRWTQKEQVCLLAAVLIYLHLMHNDFVWLYCTFFRRRRNVMEFVCIYAAIVFSPFLDEGKKQRLVAASCVFLKNAMLSSPPSFLICVLLQLRVPSFMYITGACALWSERQHLRLRCLHACIFLLKSAYTTYVIMIMLTAIMSLIALFKSKYCIYLR